MGVLFHEIICEVSFEVHSFNICFGIRGVFLLLILAAVAEQTFHSLRGTQSFQKSGRHPKVLGARRVT